MTQENLRECKRCLLRESGENAVYETVEEYIAKIPADKRVSDEVYNERLSFCRECDMLISGVCLKCGCYAEFRAAFREKRCADYNNIKWKEV